MLGKGTSAVWPASAARCSGAALVGALLLAAPSLAQNSVLYATDSGSFPPPPGITASSLYTIDPETGEASLIGPIFEQDGAITRLYYEVNGLGFVGLRPNEGDGNTGPRVLAVGSFRFQNQNVPALLELDLETGQVDRLGNLDFSRFAPANPRCTVADMSNFVSTQTLVATGACGTDPAFMIILQEPEQEPNVITPERDPIEVLRLIVGDTGFSSPTSGLTFEPGTLENFLSTPGPNFIRINPFTGEGTAIPGAAVPPGIRSLDFDPLTGQLFGALRGFGTNFLVTLDPSDGTTTVGPEVTLDGGPLPFALAAIAFSPASGCPAAPLGAPVVIPDPVTGPRVVAGFTECRQPVGTGQADLSISSSGSVSFSGTIGVAVNSTVYADPTTDRVWSLCVYETRDSATSLVMGAEAPVGPGWSFTGTGFRFASRSGDPDGLRRISLGVSRQGQAWGQVSAVGRGMNVPTLPLSPSVYAQLLSNQGDCFGATFNQPSENSESRFRAVSD